MNIRVSLKAGLVGAIAMAAMPALAEHGETGTESTSELALQPIVKGPDVWAIYGTRAALSRDHAVIGGGSIVAEPLSITGDPWKSAAAFTIDQALELGQPITVAFWAKAAAPEAVTLTMQGRDAPYLPFYEDRISLTTRWQRFVQTATAPARLAARSQAVTIMLGRAKNAVTLGPVVVLSGVADLAKVDAAFQTFRPTRVAEAVTIASVPGVSLAATLRTPVGHGPGPYPVAIFIQGNGRHGRGSFDALMDRVLANGIATLEYDKRGVGASVGTYSEDINELSSDAQAAIAAMRERGEIDGSRIALLGHSQGGVIAPMVAAADPKIAAIVTFAGPVGDGIELLKAHLYDQLVSSGRTELTVAPLVDAAMALVNARASRTDPAAIEQSEAAVINGLTANGFTQEQAIAAIASFDDDQIAAVTQFHSASDLQALRIPVLVTFGSLDPLSPAATNAAAARTALAQNPAGRVAVFDGLSHWFQEGAKTGNEDEVAALGPNIGSPRVIALVSNWLKDALDTPHGNSRPASLRR